MSKVERNPKSEIRNQWNLVGAIVAVCSMTMISLGCLGAEVSPASAAAVSPETNGQETVRSYLQLQEQIHATQLAIERTRREADEAAAESAKALAVRLQNIEQALSAQRAQELQAMQSSNKVMLIVAGAFAALGLVSMLFMAFFQWRTINRLAEISLALPSPHALGPGHAIAALGMGDAHLAGSGSTEQSNSRLLGAIDRLEQRIRELEHTTHPLVHDAGTGNGDSPTPGNSTNGELEPAADKSEPSSEATLISFLLGKGQSLLNLDKPEEALACFEEILALRAGHPEALVKKGTALEKLRRLNEAVECYDRAIAADNSMTIAYLCKGGLFNRMERYNEALECYEQALRTQEKRG
jgi:tetratricopeptide (TPR) repeat protein